MKRTITLLFAVVFSIPMFSYESLRVCDVRNSWWWEPGRIKDAFITIEPKGLYAHCSLILDFNAEFMSFNPGDSLEVQMDFNLPSGSTVTDLWLWINNEPVRAGIYDKWTASLIYESIVKRRIDPAILTKTNADEYNLKVFPLMTNMPRRVKIEYMVPLMFTGNSRAMVSLPANILRLSNQEPDFFKVFLGKSQLDESFCLAEYPETKFKSMVHPEGGDYMGILIKNPQTSSSITLQFERNQREMYFSVFQPEENIEGFYQLMFKPEKLFESVKHKKALFLLDFSDAKCNTLSTEEVLNKLRLGIKENFSDGDSVNVLFSGGKTKFLSSTWISCSSENIDGYFNSITTGIFSNYSSLATVLTDGLQFLDSTGIVCPMYVISTSNSYGSSSEANDLISDFLDLTKGKSVPVFILDLNDVDYSYSYIGGQRYKNNEYLYKYLSLLTYGETSSINEEAYFNLLNKYISKSGGYIFNLDVEVETNGGYSYSEYSLFSGESLVYTGEAFGITGKFVGQPPFVVKAHAQSADGKLLLAIDTVSLEHIVPMDSSLRIVWSSKYIGKLFAQEQNNTVISQIVQHSVSERILTPYSAFLVLEPGFIPDIDDLEYNGEIIDDGNWWQPTTIPGEELTKDKLYVFPNPAREFAQVNYNLSEDAKVAIEIVKMDGRIVSVALEEYQQAGDQLYHIDLNQLPQGVYLLRMKINGEITETVRLVIMR